MLNCRQIQKLTDSCRLLAEIWIAEERCQGRHSVKRFDMKIRQPKDFSVLIFYRIVNKTTMCITE